MAISFVGGATAVSVGNTDVSVSLTALTGGSDSAPSNGDLIIFAYNIADADNVDLNLACNTVGFAEIADLFGNGTQDANLGVYWKIHDGDTSVVGEGSLGGTDTAIQGVVMVFRGVDQGTPFDVTSTTATGTTTGDPDPPSIDWVTAGAWTVIVGSDAHAANVNGTFTGPTNYTTNFQTIGNQDTADGIIGMGYRTNPADPENPGLITTGTTATGWCAVTMALRPAANVTATPGVIALALATFAPVVTATANVLATVGVLAHTLTTFIPSVLTPRTVTPTPATQILTTFAPSIGIGVLATPSTASLVDTQFAPTVTATAHQTVVPSTLAHTTATFAPSVTTGKLVTIGVLNLGGGPSPVIVND